MPTPFMNMNLPVPTVTLGPVWAEELNTALESVVDSHDHSTGKGTRIKPDGLNINADLDIQTNYLNNVAATRLTAQPAVLAGALDLRALFSFDGDLYYNNGSGAPVRITNGVAIDVSTVGAIGGDYSTTPAVINYANANQTYTFDIATNQRGTLDAGKVIIRETAVASAQGIGLASPPALASGYDITLPAATPASTQFMTLSNTGQVDYADTDETSLETTGAGVVQIKDLGVTTAKINTGAVTVAKIGSGAVSSDKLATDSVLRSKLASKVVGSNELDFQSVGGAVASNSSSVSVTLPFDSELSTFFLTGPNAYVTGVAGSSPGGPGFSTYTLTGPSGTIASGRVHLGDFNDGQVFGFNISGGAFTFPILGTAEAGTYTLSFNNGATIVGGNGVIRGIRT